MILGSLFLSGIHITPPIIFHISFSLANALWATTRVAKCRLLNLAWWSSVWARAFPLNGVRSHGKRGKPESPTMYSRSSVPSKRGTFFPFSLLPSSASPWKPELLRTEASLSFPGQPVIMSRNRRSASTIAWRIMLQFFPWSSQTWLETSTFGKFMRIWVVSIAPQQLGSPRIFSNLDLIWPISASPDGQQRWEVPLSSIASTKRHVTWETVDWLILKDSPMLDNDFPELSRLKATATWSFKDRSLPERSVKLEGLPMNSSLTSEQM